MNWNEIKKICSSKKEQFVIFQQKKNRGEKTIELENFVAKI